MPTELPPDYKPQPPKGPNNPADPDVPGSVPAYPPEQGEDSRDQPTTEPQRDADVIGPAGSPLPAGMPAI